MKTTRLNQATRDVIFSMVQHQPCTIQQIAEYCSSNSYEVVKYLSEMARHGQILVRSVNGQLIVSSSTMSN